MGLRRVSLVRRGVPEIDGAGTTVHASAGVTEAMQVTTGLREKDTDECIDCSNDWCDGPQGYRLPCFKCYIPTSTYEGVSDE